MLPLDHIRRLSGFGQTEFRDAYVFRPENVQEVQGVLDLARKSGRQVVLRGSGRSYGDAAVGAECIALDIRGMSRILSWDPSTGIIEVESGVTLEQIWKYCLPDGWWLPVVSGTMAPTIAGALAANIHGKNNFLAGCLGEHVLEIDIQPPNSELQTLTPNDDLFYAVVGSFGLLAPIVRAKLQMKEVTSGMLGVQPVSCPSWEAQFTSFEHYEVKDADYMVSWVDCFAKGTAQGRGIFHSAAHLQGDDHYALDARSQDLPAKVMGMIPKNKVWRFLKLLNNRPAMRMVNTAKYLAGRREKPSNQSLAAYSFLLDYVPDWELAYQPGGFIQYQSFIPKERARAVFRQQIEMQQVEKLEAFLGVMKRHRTDRFLLSHGVDGYSLALDFKVTESNRTRLWALCHRMNDLVLEAGGRFYFAKDSTLRPEDARAFLGQEVISAFRSYKAQLDPENLLTSELARRLKLT